MINTRIFKAVLVTLGKWQYVLSKFYFSIYNLWWTEKVPFILVLEFWKNLIYKISVDRALCGWMFVCKRSSYVSINKFCLSRLAVIFFPVIRGISDIKDHYTCKPTHHRKSSFSGSPSFVWSRNPFKILPGNSTWTIFNWLEKTSALLK